ncbi:indole-3-glycerol phosphate synthase TrpC [Peribacillus cavernae]|uniref:Indole-3-glycerol phosphate synthase n=1 Tax=Peribacillus cavernae TaxID=1674310 RepID=A0A3S0W0Z2_9BACI|nr:indole-3-glycerol phosphate synthase TrpC [Peribacillus cavernae]MDQ0217228.1 indole-3-glycerol phosphate synthase [Peribacillus cavernae]RUQ30301.1 indole-3-glycerol phosphate synthase TrpC [Peribacillus cavernae]
MENILTKIIARKAEEVAELKERGYRMSKEFIRPCRSLYSEIKHKDSLGIIAEIKRASPSKGDISPDVIPASQAGIYEAHGAVGISVLTDTDFFKGSFLDLESVRSAVELPLLCKDFIIDEIQIDRARKAGADVILLIVAALSAERHQELYRYAHNIGLEVITEVHNEYELERAVNTGAEMIGINNRDLKTFQVDLAVTEKLANQLGKSTSALISESGIKTKEDVLRVRAAGADAILVGETFMKSDDLPNKLAEFQI